MSTFHDPFNPGATLAASGCGCGRHRSPVEHAAAVTSDPGEALAIEPKMLLMDEPFSALDALARGVLQEEVLRICAETRQTVFMTTHDVDEAILLADKIVLMTNGPRARIAEAVLNTLPRDRNRHDMHRHPHYYPIRNHLLDFLIERSRTFDREMEGRAYDPKNPPLVIPGITEAAAERRAAPALLDL